VPTSPQPSGLGFPPSWKSSSSAKSASKPPASRPTPRQGLDKRVSLTVRVEVLVCGRRAAQRLRELSRGRRGRTGSRSAALREGGRVHRPRARTGLPALIRPRPRRAPPRMHRAHRLLTATLGRDLPAARLPIGRHTPHHPYLGHEPLARAASYGGTPGTAMSLPTTTVPKAGTACPSVAVASPTP
jgi:hypothetical protein